MVTDDIFSIGTGIQEVALNKDEFCALLQKEFSV
jgi:hypothetical protein